MKNFVIIVISFYALLAGTQTLAQSNNPQKPPFAIAIHGGAGTILQSTMTPEKEKLYKQGLQNALDAGYAVLEKGGSALDAVQAAVMVLEDNPLFNAGKGAVFTHDGKNELDAAIMDGNTLKAGSVAGITNVKNPITAARAVMDKSEHVMMTGKGAEAFAKLQGCTIVSPSYFYTKERWLGLQKAIAADSSKTQLDHAAQPSKASLKQRINKDYKYGTVGAVAVDIQGNLAAATSTGGMTNKKFGRVGDAPIIGAGTYAQNNTCAISCTGWGEYFIRLVMAKSISDRVELSNKSLEDAANDMIFNKLSSLGGDGGLIAIDKNLHIAMPFNTAGMYRGYKKSNGEMLISIYKN